MCQTSSCSYTSIAQVVFGGWNQSNYGVVAVALLGGG